MKVTTAVIIKISTILDIFENDMSKCYDIFRHFDTNFALDIFDIFVVFRHVVTTLVFKLYGVELNFIVCQKTTPRGLERFLVIRKL